MEPIILASGSHKRQEYFKLLGLPFSVLPALIDEKQTKSSDPLKLTSDLAVRKVQKVIEVMKDRMPRWICGADTVITMDGKIFGKPANREEARQMLVRFSGRQHKVITSMALYSDREETIDCRSATCTVNFASITDAEIEWYLNTNEWQGAAGAYRIQGLAGCLIDQIKGSPSTVAGLPLRDFYVMLRDNGYPYGV
ncbi:MAG: Maf family protein [Treponema sp.]|jgi:septum formation protein|nr:Maf family protein [Treponema sp.]